MEETIVDKTKENIKRLDISINATHNSLTPHLSILFSILTATAKHAILATAQAYASQVKTVAQAYISFLANVFSQLHQEYDLIIKDKDVCSLADSLISGHSLTIDGLIPTSSSSPSPNPQVLDPAAQISQPNQSELRDAGKLEENLLRDDNFLMFLPHNARN